MYCPISSYSSIRHFLVPVSVSYRAILLGFLMVYRGLTTFWVMPVDMRISG